MKQTNIEAVKHHLAKVAAKTEGANDGFVERMHQIVEQIGSLDPDKDGPTRWAYETALWSADAALGNYELKRHRLALACIVMIQIMCDERAASIYGSACAHLQLLKQVQDGMHHIASVEVVAMMPAKLTKIPKKPKRKKKGKTLGLGGDPSLN